MARFAIGSLSVGDNQLLSGSPDKELEIKKMVLWARTAVNVILKEGTTTINGLGFNLPTQAGFILDARLSLEKGKDFVVNVNVVDSLAGWFET